MVSNEMENMGTYGNIFNTYTYGDAKIEVENLLQGSCPTIEEIFSAMSYVLIKVPREPSICPVFHQPEVPELYCSEIINEQEAFVISGMGVVAGKCAYERLKNCKLLLWWD